MLKKIIKVIKNPKLIMLHFMNFKICRFIPDKLFLRIKFKLYMGQRLDLDNPKTFNEKLQWLKLYDRNPFYTKLVDKYEVRKFIKEVIGDEYLIPLIGVWDDFNQIDFSKLPNQFVLKCNHDSGGLVICKDKSKLDINLARKKINKSLKRNFYRVAREWPYKNVKRKIVCEKYLKDNLSKDLNDYKLMCFNGKVMCTFVCSNRSSSNGLNVDFYDNNWNHMPFQRHYPNNKNIVKKPRNFEKMIEIAERLSKGIPFVRIDFYDVSGKIYFGEMTFYPGAGFEEFTPESYDHLLGNWIKLKSN